MLATETAYADLARHAPASQPASRRVSRISCTAVGTRLCAGRQVRSGPASRPEARWPMCTLAHPRIRT